MQLHIFTKWAPLWPLNRHSVWPSQSHKGYGQLISTRHHVRGRIVWSSSHSARGSYSGYGNSISGSGSGSDDSECRRWVLDGVHPGDCDVTDTLVASDDVMLARRRSQLSYESSRPERLVSRYTSCQIYYIGDHRKNCCIHTTTTTGEFRRDKSEVIRPLKHFRCSIIRDEVRGDGVSATTSRWKLRPVDARRQRTSGGASCCALRQEWWVGRIDQRQRQHRITSVVGCIVPRPDQPARAADLYSRQAGRPAAHRIDQGVTGTPPGRLSFTLRDHTCETSLTGAVYAHTLCRRREWIGGRGEEARRDILRIDRLVCSTDNRACWVLSDVKTHHDVVLCSIRTIIYARNNTLPTKNKHSGSEQLLLFSFSKSLALLC